MIGVLFPPLWPERASSAAGDVDALCISLIAVTFAISVAIAATLIYFAVKYRRTTEDAIGVQHPGSARTEVVWIVALIPLALAMFLGGARVYYELYNPPAEGIKVQVVAKQWMWKFQHPAGQAEINELHVPVGRTIKLVLASEDVIHSFFVPAFRLKMDAVPGRYRTAWFRVLHPGRYHLFCAEYCGTNHSGMGGWVVAMTPAEYQSWLDGQGAFLSPASQGEKLFQDLSCNACHRSDTQGRGPFLHGLFGQPVLLDSGQVVTADEDYIRESILDPRRKIVAGFQPIMPTFKGQLNEEQLLQLIAYIRSLQPLPSAAARPGATQPAGRVTTPELPQYPDSQRSNPGGATPPRLVPVAPPQGEETP